MELRPPAFADVKVVQDQDPEVERLGLGQVEPFFQALGGGRVAWPEFGPGSGLGKSNRKFPGRVPMVETPGCAYCG